jgi:hypothetical protein
LHLLSRHAECDVRQFQDNPLDCSHNSAAQRVGAALSKVTATYWSRHDVLSPSCPSAKVFVAHGRDGTDQQILVIATTAELDPQSERYKKCLVEKLSAAARDYVARSDRVTAFLLMNPMKDWRPPAEASRHHQDAAGAATVRRASPASA